MAKSREECEVVLYKEGGIVKARYLGKVASTELSMQEEVGNNFDLGANQSKADDIMSAAESAMDSDESIS